MVWWPPIRPAGHDDRPARSVWAVVVPIPKTLGLGTFAVPKDLGFFLGPSERQWLELYTRIVLLPFLSSGLLYKHPNLLKDRRFHVATCRASIQVLGFLFSALPLRRRGAEADRARPASRGAEASGFERLQLLGRFLCCMISSI